jgi:hypothetical protein
LWAKTLKRLKPPPGKESGGPIFSGRSSSSAEGLDQPPIVVCWAIRDHVIQWSTEIDVPPSVSPVVDSFDEVAAQSPIRKGSG